MRCSVFCLTKALRWGLGGEKGGLLPMGLVCGEGGGCWTARTRAQGPGPSPALGRQQCPFNTIFCFGTPALLHRNNSAVAPVGQKNIARGYGGGGGASRPVRSMFPKGVLILRRRHASWGVVPFVPAAHSGRRGHTHVGLIWGPVMHRGRVICAFQLQFAAHRAFPPRQATVYRHVPKTHFSGLVQFGASHLLRAAGEG